jgi:hypothetical protein
VGGLETATEAILTSRLLKAPRDIMLSASILSIHVAFKDRREYFQFMIYQCQLKIIMSGVETVVGLVLGVLPLLVSAAEHYDDVFRPFRRYKRFSKELKQFQQEFLAEKTIFRNECRLLLSAFIGMDTANEMLREHYHPLRKDLHLNKKLSDQLGASLEACQVTIRSIIEELSGIDSETRRFEQAMPKDVPVSRSLYSSHSYIILTQIG